MTMVDWQEPTLIHTQRRLAEVETVRAHRSPTLACAGSWSMQSITRIGDVIAAIALAGHLDDCAFSSSLRGGTR